MKRWIVSGWHGECEDIKMYSPTLDDAKRTFPNAVISEIDDSEHVPFIKCIIKKSDKLYEVCKNGYQLQEFFNYISDIGKFTIILFKDLRDNHYYDYMEYSHYKKYSYIHPLLKTMTTPQKFYEEFITKSDFSFEIISITKCPGNGEKLAKPTDLKGVNQIGSVKFSKALNGVFVCGNDLYIKCNDYFSPSLETQPQDVGTSLSYRVKKYLGKAKTEKFIYADSWGDIVLKQKAWLKFSGFISLLPHYNDTQIADMCCEKIQRHHHLKDELEVEWHIMFEDICKLVRNSKKGGQV